MFSDIVKNFEDVTKFKLLEYFEEYQDFMQHDFSHLSDYFSGQTEGIDAKITSKFNSLVLKSKNIIQTFKNFSSKLSLVVKLVVK